MKSMVTAALAAGVFCAGGGALKAETLKLGVKYVTLSLDPHFRNHIGNNQVAGAIFEQLVDRDAAGKLISRLALEWRVIDDLTWEFKLRPHVTFHNKNAFTADDVAYSITRIPTIENSPASFKNLVESIKDVQVIDDLTLRFVTHFPNPTLPLDLSTIYIIDKETAQGVETADYDKPETVVGTGPLKLQGYRPQEAIEFARNDSYWGEPSTYDLISYRMIPDDAARAAGLLSGGVDFIDQVTPSDAAKIAEQGNFKIVQAHSLRSIYINIDQSGLGTFALTNDGKPLPASALQDLRIRKALSLAIDRQALAERIMEGAAIGTGQLMPEGAPGYVKGLLLPKADLDEARKLLAEAGYPEGFRITLHGPNGNYLNDAALAQAVGQMWTRLGVKTEVVVLPFANLTSRAAKQEFSAFISSWGSTTGEAGNTLRSVVHTWDAERGLGSVNRHRYSNPEVDRLIRAYSTQMDPAQRVADMEKAMTIAMEDLAVIPLILTDTIAAMKKDVGYVGRLDGIVRPEQIGRSTQP